MADDWTPAEPAAPAAPAADAWTPAQYPGFEAKGQPGAPYYVPAPTDQPRTEDAWVPATPAPAAAPVAPTGGLTDPRTGMFPFNYVPIERELAREGMHQMSRGVAKMRGEEPTYTEGKVVPKLEAAGDVALGGLRYVTAPVTGAVRSILSQPLENVSGLPKEYTEFTTELLIPGLGMTKLPKALDTTVNPALRHVQKTLAPETVSPVAQDAAALIRQHTGTAARATETTAAELEAAYRPFEAIAQNSPADAYNIMNWIDGGKNAVRPPPQILPFVDKLKEAFRARRAELEALPEGAKQEFRAEYFPHFWKDPSGAPVTEASWGIGRQGSAASLKQRSIPTIEEGLARGLVPMFTNPVEATLRYIMSTDKFIAAEKIKNAALDAGIVQRVQPKVVGASGRPGALAGVPQGYVPLAGRGGENLAAPEAWARIYNNWLSPGFERNPTHAPIYNALRQFTNFTTQTLLGLSGYHALTMAEATISTEVARTAGYMRGAAGKILPNVTAPVTYATRGRKLKDIYLGRAAGNAEDQEIVDLITQAGGRMAGTRHALDYSSTPMGNYWTAWQRGKLAAEAKGVWQDVRAHPIAGTARQALSGIARSMQTINKPLFEHYIPNIKNGAAGELVADWLRANPGATRAEKLAQTRRIVDEVDNRFGEMIQDNIFWDKMLKQGAMAALLSYSWNVGGVRAIGGGLRDIARTAMGKQAWSPKADYVVSTALNWAAMSAIYQTLKTGQPPWSTDTPMRDLMAPRTGGVDYRSGEPERIIVPGIMKDVFAYWEHPFQEAANKLNPGMKGLGQLLSNSNWRGDPIFAPKSDEEQGIFDMMPVWLGNLFEFVAKTGTPITMQNIGKREQGSNLSAPERALGVRTAPRYLVDPEGWEAMRQRIERQKWFGKRGRGGKIGHDAAERERYGGTGE